MRTAAAVLAAVLLAGCSSGPSGSSGSSGDPSVAPTGSSASPAASSSPTGLPLKDGAPKLELVGKFAAPTHLAAPPGDPRLFVVEQGGRVRIVKDGKTVKTPFLDLSKEVRHRGEQGMLSIAFAPDFATSKRFYVDYNGTDGDVRVEELQVGDDPDRADLSTRRMLLVIHKPHENHNGGQLAFDADGMLLVSTGDGGSGNDPDRNAQNLGVLLGKILRIDPRPAGGKPYDIPPDNPFVSTKGARPEVWAYGLRNPWRFSLDRESGVLYVGDVGQYVIEELDAVPAGRQRGANFGWRVFEGRRRNFPEGVNPAGRLVTPVHQFNHDDGRCVITAGVVYRGSVRVLRGRFLFGEFCTGALFAIKAGTQADPPVTTLAIKAPQVSSFGVGGDGEVYVVSSGGQVWRISA